MFEGRKFLALRNGGSAFFPPRVFSAQLDVGLKLEAQDEKGIIYMR
jgi:hypothetical protein